MYIIYMYIYLYIHMLLYTIKYGVLFDTLECQSHYNCAISTPKVSYNTPLVWYAHFVFTVYMYCQLVAGEIIH